MSITTLQSSYTLQPSTRCALSAAAASLIALATGACNLQTSTWGGGAPVAGRGSARRNNVGAADASRSTSRKECKVKSEGVPDDVQPWKATLENFNNSFNKADCFARGEAFLHETFARLERKDASFKVSPTTVVVFGVRHTSDASIESARWKHWLEVAEGAQRAYWSKRIAQTKSFEEAARRSDDGECVFAESSPSPGNTGRLKLVWKGTESDVVVRCTLPKPLRSYTRDAKDYLRVIQSNYGTEYDEKYNVVYKSSDGRRIGDASVEFKVPVEAIKKDLQRRGWSAFAAHYVIPSRGDFNTWKHDVFASGAFVMNAK